MIKKRYTICLFLMLSAVLLKGQDTKKVLGTYFKEVRAGKHQSIPKQLSLPENAKATLSALPPYLSDTIAVVRAKAYTLLQLAGTNSSQASLREDAVTKLTEACKDHDSGNVGIALNYLTAFKKEDFTVATKDTLVNLFKRKTPHYDKLIKLIGFLELKQVQADLRALSQQSTASKKDRWAAITALARMGDGYATEDMMKRVRKMPVNDDVVYQLFPDLVYTRQREAIELLIETLNNDAKNCASANAEHETKIPCGYRVMEMLAPVIEGYPLAVDESGDVDTKDYVGALKQVREWFKANPDYKIDKSRF